MTKITYGDLRYLGLSTQHLYNKKNSSIYVTMPEKSRGFRDCVVCHKQHLDSRTIIYITPEILEIADFWIINEEEDPEYFI